MNLTTKLTHRITVTPVSGQNSFGEPSTGTAVQSVACFIDGSHRRVLKSSGRDITVNFSIYFLPTVNIGVDYLVSGGVTKKGVSVLASGRVVFVEKSFHPQTGLTAIEALVEGN